MRIEATSDPPWWPWAAVGLGLGCLLIGGYLGLELSAKGFPLDAGGGG